MFRNVPWMEFVGASVMGAVNPYLEGGSVSFLKNIKDVNLWASGLVIASDVFAGDHLHGAVGDTVHGAAAYEAGYLVGELVKKYAKQTTTTTTTSAPADFILTQAAPQIQAPIAAVPDFGGIDSFAVEA